MYYEVYMDVLFLKNLWMDLLLLLAASWSMGLERRFGRILAAAILGASGCCVLTALSASLNRSGYFLATLALAAGMAKAAYPGWKRLWERVLAVYLEGLLLGGMVRYLEQLHGAAGYWFLMSGSLAAALVPAAEWYRGRRRREQSVTCRVILSHGKARVELEALYDTGNSLRDPLTGRPVSILEQGVLQALLTQSGTETLPRLIPYRTIAQEGLLEAYMLEEMRIEEPEGIRVIRRPLLADVPGYTGQYRMILHRDLLSS